jgi:hypothetical protein
MDVEVSNHMQALEDGQIKKYSSIIDISFLAKPESVTPTFTRSSLPNDCPNSTLVPKTLNGLRICERIKC